MAYMEKCGSLWVHQDKNGNDYMTGVIDGKKIVVFSNKHKQEDKHPDWIIYPQQDRPQPKKDDEVPF